MKSSLLSFFVLLLVCRCGASTIEITTTKVPNGTVDASYSSVIAAKGGCTPYKWQIASGKLPSGISDKSSGNTSDLDLSGTPTNANSYSFTASVTDCGGHVAKESYTLTIQQAAEHVVSLKWNASTSKEIAGYNVYRGPNGTTWTKINAGLVPVTDYDDSTVSNGSTYYYSAASVNISGEESPKSTAVKITVP
jgi:Putative Ig domain